MKMLIVRSKVKTYAINPLEVMFISMYTTYVEIKLVSGLEIVPNTNCNDLEFWINEWHMAVNSKDR